MRRARSLVAVIAAAAGAGIGLTTAGASGQVITLPPITTTTLAPVTDPITEVVGSLVTTTTVAVGGVTVPVPVVTTTVPVTVPVNVPTTLPAVTVPGTGGVVATVVDCASFATQTLAQAALVADPTLAGALDPDHDGVACELLPATPGLPVATTTPGGSPSSGAPSPWSGVTSAGGATSTANSSWGGAGAAGAAATSPSGVTSAGGAGSPALSRRSAGTGAAGTRTVDLTRPSQSAVEAAASSPLPDGDGGPAGPAHVLLKVIAFVMLLGVTAAAAAQRDELLAGLVAARS